MPMVTQLPLEELTRLCVYAHLSNSDGSINLSVRSSNKDATQPQSPLPSGYQINFETSATGNGTILIVSVSQVGRDTSPQGGAGLVSSDAQMTGSEANSAALDLTMLASSSSCGAPHIDFSSPEVADQAMFDPRLAADQQLFAGLYNDMGIFSERPGVSESGLMNDPAMSSLFPPNDVGLLQDMQPASYLTNPFAPPDESQQSLSPPSSSSSPSPTSSSSSPAHEYVKSTPQKRKNDGGAKGRIFTCTMGCNEDFSRQHDRFRHEVLKHERSCKWVCDTCHKFFASEKNLQRHACNTRSRWTARSRAPR
ncbi:hypothetical protein HDZ31DRAFT_59923 [Schizophyllum fasciatum]